MVMKSKQAKSTVVSKPTMGGVVLASHHWLMDVGGAIQVTGNFLLLSSSVS